MNHCCMTTTISQIACCRVLLEFKQSLGISKVIGTQAKDSDSQRVVRYFFTVSC
jgi:hypothetical protein